MTEIEEVLGGPEYAPFTALLITLMAATCAAFLAMGASPLATLGASANATAAIVTGVVGICLLLAATRFVRRGDWRYKAAGWTIIGFAVTAIVLVASPH